MSFALTIQTAEDLATEARAGIRAAIKSRRDRALDAGTTVGGMPVATDDTSQSRITGAALAVTLDPGATIRWKCADGAFATLDAAAIIVIAQAVRAHVQACFDREAALLAALDAGEAYEIDTGWPES